jgi:hypothetical protein
VTDWNVVALDTLAVTPSYVFQTRNLAMVHAAIYDAVNSIERRYPAYKFIVPALPGASSTAAAAQAAHDVLALLYPAQQMALDVALAKSLSIVPDGPDKAAGVNVGKSVAAQIFALRSVDGSATPRPYAPGSGPGAWISEVVPPLPGNAYNWPLVTPWFLDTGAQFRPNGPPRLRSRRYAIDFNEVKSLGRATGSARSVDQTEAALFWAPFAHILWNQAARELSIQYGLALTENARFFAWFNLATADGAIAGFDAKYAFNFWRPITAIHHADEDGNPATTADVTWIPLLNTPNHPDYVSTHSVNAGAAEAVLECVFGARRVSIDLTSSNLPGVTHHYSRLKHITEENNNARVWAGIHFRKAVIDGARLGRRVAGVALKYLGGCDHEEEDD